MSGVGVTLSGARTIHPCDAIYVCGLELPGLIGSSVLDVPIYVLDCFDEDGETLKTIVAEVNNTPWGERDTYVLPESMDVGRRGIKRFKPKKKMHVSPFMPMDLEYRWHFSIKADELKIAMGLFRKGEETFNAGLRLSVAPMTRSRLLRGMARYPLQNVVTLARIYWQALRLYLKRSRFYPHPDRAEEAPAS